MAGVTNHLSEYIQLCRDSVPKPTQFGQYHKNRPQSQYTITFAQSFHIALDNFTARSPTHQEPFRYFITDNCRTGNPLTHYTTKNRRHQPESNRWSAAYRQMFYLGTTMDTDLRCKLPKWTPIVVQTNIPMTHEATNLVLVTGYALPATFQWNLPARLNRTQGTFWFIFNCSKVARGTRCYVEREIHSDTIHPKVNATSRQLLGLWYVSGFPTLHNIRLLVSP